MKTLDELDALWREVAPGRLVVMRLGEDHVLLGPANEAAAGVGRVYDEMTAALIVALVNAWPEVRERLRRAEKIEAEARETGDALADVCGRWLDEGMGAGDLAAEMEAAASVLQGFALITEEPRQ